MNSRERFHQTMQYGTPDHVPCFEDGLREGVLDVWRQQGLPPDDDLARQFPHDRHELVDPDSDPWTRSVERWRNRDHVLMMRVHDGIFLSLGVEGWTSFREVVRLLVRDPAFVRKTMRAKGKAAARVMERVLRRVEIDAAIFVEPLCDNTGPLISPRMYQDFAPEGYGPVFEVLRRHGVETFVFMSFGNPRPLLPMVVNLGFNCLWACEVNPETMSYADIRREFGPKLRLIGGIDLDALRQDTHAIEREFRRAGSLLGDGGYIPLADGRIREDVPYGNYVHYRRQLERITGFRK